MTQNMKIVSYLRTHREATTMELIQNCGTTSPHRRITEINKARVHKILGRWAKLNGKRLKKYWLARTKVAA